MNLTIKIPSQALHYILLQRTLYQTRTLSRLLRYLPGFPSHLFSQLEVVIRKRYISERFQRGIVGDFISIKESLPQNASLILDIGCGVAGIDILLYRHYTIHNSPHLYLSDFSDTSSSIRYDFSSSPVRYNSLEVASLLLSMNGVPEELIHFVNPTKIEDLEMSGKFNLVISTLSWGFHYPVEIYLNAVYRLLADSGKLILDVRNATDGVDHIRETFRNVDILTQTETKSRVVAIK